MKARLGLGAVALALTLGLAIGRGRSDGIPLKDTLYYSGYLQQNGVPVDATVSLTINVWADAAGQGTPLCQTVASQAEVKQGWFRIALVDPCRDRLAASADAFVEVVYGATSLGRTKIGAVPYAIEAARASAAAGTLAQQVVPGGAVMAFDLDACPPGWTPFAPAAGRAVIGVNDGKNGLSARTRGAAVGAETHTLTAAEIPAHTHGGTTGAGNPMVYRSVGALGTNSAANHAAGWMGTANFIESNDANYAMAGHTHSFVTDGGPGAGKPHNNVPPSVALLYCRKN